MRSKLNGDYFWALAALGALAILALLWGLSQFATGSDRAALEREQSVIANGLKARIGEIEDLVVPNAVWDQAVLHLDNRFSQAWARENVGLYYSTTAHFSLSGVLNASDRLIYLMEDGDEPLSAADRQAIQAAAALLVQRVRGREALGSNTSPQGALSNPIQESAPKWIGERLYIVTATLVQPDFGHARIAHRRAPIVLTGRELDAAFLTAFASRYMINDLHLHEGDSRAEPNEAHVAITDDAGADIATLDWLPQKQGEQLYATIAPWLVAVLALMLGATLALYARARRATRGLAESERRSTHMAYHDSLTGLPNRPHFETRLVEAVEGGEAFAVHCLDLDHFKELNDSYGHPVGDELLAKAGERLRTVVNAIPGACCARLGGDEFALIHAGGPDTANVLAEALVEAFSRPFSLSVGDRYIPCSVGVALSDEASDPAEMLRRADMALYRAKAEGRGRYRFFDPEMDAGVRAMRILKEDLRRDLAAGKLHMVYQPQVRLTGEVVGVEALVRWTHGQQGPISPALFVPLAEEAGLIGALGDFTLRQASADSLRWPGVKTAINISATQLQQPDFVEHATALVRASGAEPSTIELELTEGVLLSNDERTTNALHHLHDAGFSIALDDFGTGYSSLSYLPRFPIDKIKIDRSFVTTLGSDTKADALFGAIVRLAQSLEMRVIAEGVETNEQWLRLTAAGCPKVQGYIASPPLDADTAVDFLANAKREANRRTDEREIAAA